MNYTTDHEIWHITNIGKRKYKEHKRTMSREKLLKLYRKACFKRYYWDKLDREKIFQHLDTLIGDTNG